MKYCAVCDKIYGDDIDVCAVDGTVLRKSGPREDPFIGRVIKGRYRVLSRIGEGGMGTVYLAEQISVGRKVALKVLLGEFAREDEVVRHFRQEARLAASLSHRNITTVFDFDQADDGSLFIVMEYLEGRTLKELIRQEGSLKVESASRIGIEIAEGLAAAHRAGVIHRDVKSQNIMVIRPGDQVKLMDFGIARLMNAGATQLTRTGFMMGTPEYMAPEQIEGQEVTEKTDIYAFGIVLYEMLAGATPFAATTAAAILAKHLRERPAPLAEVRADVPPALAEVVMQALEKEPGSRQASMEAVLQRLRSVAGQLGETPAALRAPTIVAPPTVALEATVVQPASQARSRDTTSVPATAETPVVAELPTVVLPGPRTRSRSPLVLAGASVLLVVLVGAVALWWAAGGGPTLARRPEGERPSALPGTRATPDQVAGGALNEVQGQASEGGQGTKPEAPKEPAGQPREESAPKTEVRPPPKEPARTQDTVRRREEADARRRTEAGPSGQRLSDKGGVQQSPEGPSPGKAARPMDPARAKAEAGRSRTEPKATPKGIETPKVEQPQPEAPPKETQGTLPAKKEAPLPDPGRLRVLVEQRLRDSGLLKEKGRDGGVTVEITDDRVVTLTGVLRDQEQRDQALRLAGEVPGVSKVRSRINPRESWQLQQN